MPVLYLDRLIHGPEEFTAKRDAGGFNPNSTYEGYLQMIRSQVALVEQDKAEAAARGFELNPVELDLSPEMEAILDEVWAELRARKQAEQEVLVAA